MFVYLEGYSEKIKIQVKELFNNNLVEKYLFNKYKVKHNISTDKLLYGYVDNLRKKYLKKTKPLNKVKYDSKIKLKKQALGLNIFNYKIHGNKTIATNEIKISTDFKNVPEEFLRFVVIHELAHLKEKEHNKEFYKLCTHIEKNYFQFELDMRIYLTYIKLTNKYLW
ncbi:hypothetical protein EV215_0484 [Hypnocyclicus thermotrophus]|uniref:YgjP-like metallopeptidase domain-containing protein n=1 Tax=Hypnocyclicus thermotrophus TaxID=1627895 RepID=A0AA46DZH8_9FUSO|nr:YgjP-like metallopeptidase domain-containing protein [Hypnocyclicus thermotrophus]TDT71800.1 hypothetical protein EV215_0484 [Hypnocyclicus thermotrophus]